MIEQPEQECVSVTGQCLFGFPFYGPYNPPCESDAIEHSTLCQEHHTQVYAPNLWSMTDNAAKRAMEAERVSDDD